MQEETLKIIIYISLKSIYKRTCTLIFKSFIEKKLPKMSCSFKTDQPLLRTQKQADVYRVWFTVTLVHRNVYFAAITIDYL